jgi:glycosyltransferase involved in cell wall biosynthesis
MRVVIDLQGAQGVNRNRGIGRLSRALTRAMISGAGPHEPIVLLNEAASESSEQLMEEFSALVPRSNIHFWHGLANASAIGDAQSVARRRASEQIRAHSIASLGADVVFLASVVEGATDDTVTNWPASLERPLHAATFYDAIPLMNPDQYLRGDWKPLAGWYFRQVQELRMYDSLLAISESARQEAINYLHFDPRRVSNIRAGFDRTVFRPVALTTDEKLAFLARHELRDEYILFVGAGDARKNELGLLQAFSLLSNEMRRQHQLVIVGASYPERLKETAQSYGIDEQDLGFIRHVSEEDLPVLYSLSAVFAMPSKHEGFGLPALEAMACGAAVIASNTTSLPEVVGREDALFDPNEPSDIAEKLQKSLKDGDFRKSLKDHGLLRAQEFTWEESARRSWVGLEELYGSSNRSNETVVTALPIRKPSLAYVTAYGQASSGLFDDASDLLPDLARYYDITLVTDATRDDGLDRLRAIFPSISTEQFDSANFYDRVVYDIRNTDDNAKTSYSLIFRHAGIALLHDTSLSPMILTDYRRTGNRGKFLADLFASHGWAAVAATNQNPTEQAMEEWPCTLPIFQNALGVVVHSQKAHMHAVRHLGKEVDKFIVTLRHCRWPLPRYSKAKARSELHLNGKAPIVGRFGGLLTAQHAREIMAIWRRATKDQSSARLVFVGPTQAEVQKSLLSLAQQEGYSDQLIFTGRLEFDRYQRWLSAVDVAMQLDSNIKSDVIDPIVDAIAAGIPTIVYRDQIDFAGIPQSCAVVLDNELREPNLENALRDLLLNTEGQSRISKAALSFTQTHFSPTVLAMSFHTIIERAYTQTEAACLQTVLSAIPSSSDISAARALAGTFQLAEPRRLMLGVGKERARAGTLKSNYPWVSTLLTARKDGWFVEIVHLHGQALHCNRHIPVTLLGVTGCSLPDAPMLGSPNDILFLIEKNEYRTPDGIGELKRLRRRGVQLIVLLNGNEDDSDSELLALADQAACSPSIRLQVETSLKRLELRRSRPLELRLFDINEIWEQFDPIGDRTSAK